MALYHDYSIRVRKTTTNLRTFFEVILYDIDYRIIEGIFVRNRAIAYISAYRLMLKHCQDLSWYNKFYLSSRLIGYYFYLFV